MCKLNNLLSKIASGDVSYFLDLSYLKNMIKNDKIIYSMVETDKRRPNEKYTNETK